MALLILNADGRYVKHSSDWASTLSIFKNLQKEYKEFKHMAFEVCLPENMTVQNFEGYLRYGPFMGSGADNKYRVNVITDWQRHVRARCRKEDVAVALAEEEELLIRLAQEDWKPAD